VVARCLFRCPFAECHRECHRSEGPNSAATCPFVQQSNIPGTMSFLHILLGALAVLGCVGARPEPKTEAPTASAKSFYIFGYGSLLHEGSRIRVSYGSRPWFPVTWLTTV